MNSIVSKSRCIIPIFSALLILLSSPAFALEMRTVVKDFVTTEWTLECPDGEILDITTVNMTDQGIEEFIRCLGEIESENGINITSHTVVEDFVVKSDEIVGTTEMTEAQVNKLKGIIDTHRIPSNVVPFNRPRIESIVLNGVVDSFIIVLPNGCVIDLTDVDIDPQVLQELIQLIEQFEMENGTHVTSSTTVKDGDVEKDRIIAITHLTGQQIQQLLQFFQSKGIALLLQQKLVPIEMHGILDVNGAPMPFNATGDALIQLPPPDPQTGAFPIEIRQLNLQSVAPIDITVGLNHNEWELSGFLHPVDHTGKLNAFDGQLPNLVFHNVGPDQVTLLADPDFAHEFGVFGCGPWPFHEAMHLHSLGRKHLLEQSTSEANRGFVRINHLEVGLPLRVPVIPNGLGN